MPVVAVPGYLGKDFHTASPGLRFGMFLSLWGKNNRTGDVDWSTKDTNYRVAGQQRQEREFKDDNKRGALEKALQLSDADIKSIEAIFNRQSTLANHIASSGQLLTMDAESISPFTTGLGNEHPLENGFSFLWPYGLPYLPGSGVKGVLRQSARELAGMSEDAKWDVTSGWSSEAITALFGSDDQENQQRGALQFWDVIPQIKGKSLTVEVMTGHQSHYYQKNETPHDSGQPIPINFLTVPAGSGFNFNVTCDRPFLSKNAPDLAKDDQWKVLLKEAFEHAFDWLGFGAKTAVGYGAMKVDQYAVEEREQQARQNAFEALSEEEQLMQTLRSTYEDESAKGQLQGGCKTAELRMNLLRVAENWEPGLRASAADLIEEITKKLPWSKKAKKQGIQDQVKKLRDE